MTLIEPATAMVGHIGVPGDKSISHRALILGALATGHTRITGLLEAEDVMATAKAVAALGAEITGSNGAFEVRGQGVGGLRAPSAALDFGNSGTGSRLMLGVVAGHDMQVKFTGDASLRRRPIGRVLAPLTAMGLQADGEAERATLPLVVRGTQDLLPIVYDLPVPSAQVKSAILLAGMHAPGRTTIVEPLATRDHTERMLAYFGGEVEIEDRGQGARAVTVCGDAELHGAAISVPGDPSSAAFMIAAALISPGSDIVVESVLMNPTRSGFIETLREMGASIEVLDRRHGGGEPVGDLRVRASALRGVSVPAERAPSMIDEYPVLACVAAFAEGETRMQGLAELKLKESDRLSATAAGLAACGVVAHVEGDDLTVEGGRGVKGGGLVATHMDHRVAMAFLTLGLGAANPVTVDDISMIATSFPGFAPLMTRLGAQLQ
ncbi:MAG TPA: 3-phosphoshikimate 1-carboxyvinyltransferase [Rhizobiales bacterium]|nr:3-phosphoshikimate 1-carboxyvinyltransferase [Hyphomicrobiales bacterium]